MVWLICASTAIDGAGAQLGWRFLAVPLGLTYGLVPYAVVGRRVVRPPASPADDASHSLGATQRTAWATHMSSPVIIATAAAALFLSTAIAAFVAPGAWPAVAAVVIVLLVFSEIRVTADRRGLRVTAGLVHLPIKRIPLGDIADVSAERIDPMRWGGWGYRVLPGRRRWCCGPAPGSSSSSATAAGSP